MGNSTPDTDRPDTDRPGTGTPQDTGSRTADLTDLSDVVSRVTAAAGHAGAVVLDQVRLPETGAPVTLTSTDQLETLLRAGAPVLYVDADVLTADLADEMNTPDLSEDLDDEAAAEITSAGRQLRTHLGQTASVRLAVAYGSVLHVLEASAPWLDEFHRRILSVGFAHLEAMEAAGAVEDRAHAERAAAAGAWFDALVDRLVGDDVWLALTQEAGRKQHVRALAESELGPDYEDALPHARSAASMVNQAVQLAFCQRGPVLEQRAAALAARLPQLASTLAVTVGYRGATKEQRQRLAREHLTQADPLVKTAGLVSDLVRAADAVVADLAASASGHEPALAGTPGLF